MDGVQERWAGIRGRYEAWWSGNLTAGPLLQVTAVSGDRAALQEAATGVYEPPEDLKDLYDWYADPVLVLPRIENQIAGTYYAGDAFPAAFPVSTGLPAIEAAYLGCPYQLTQHSAWLQPIIRDIQHTSNIIVDPHNRWWQASQRLLDTAGKRWKNRYAIGIPDLQGGGHIAAEMRGTQAFATDLVDHPAEAIELIGTVNAAWFEYYKTCFSIIHQYTEGYVDWLGVWSDSPAVTVECDFGAMISPAMFRRFFLPALEGQIAWVPRTIFHLDGPQMLPHLETLLSLDELDGIQWVPGPVQPAMEAWLPLLQQIQAAGKLVVIACTAAEVAMLVSELDANRLLLTTNCDSPEAADRLVEQTLR